MAVAGDGHTPNRYRPAECARPRAQQCETSKARRAPTQRSLFRTWLWPGTATLLTRSERRRLRRRFRVAREAKAVLKQRAFQTLARGSMPPWQFDVTANRSPACETANRASIVAQRPGRARPRAQQPETFQAREDHPELTPLATLLWPETVTLLARLERRRLRRRFRVAREAKAVLKHAHSKRWREIRWPRAIGCDDQRQLAGAAANRVSDVAQRPRRARPRRSNVKPPSHVEPQRSVLSSEHGCGRGRPHSSRGRSAAVFAALSGGERGESGAEHAHSKRWRAVRCLHGNSM